VGAPVTYAQQWAVAFFWTCLLEGAVHQAVLTRWEPSRGHVAAVTVGLNLVTHPALWFLSPVWAPRWAWWTGNEALVALVEAALLARWLRARGETSPRAMGGAVALSANLVSAGVGLIVWG
jgi:hypothetical protein